MLAAWKSPTGLAGTRSVRSTVLVVEHDLELAGAMVDVLDRYGFRTDRAATAARCLELWRTADLVLLDLDLPDQDGLEVCSRIGGERPVIVVSARAAESDRVVALEMGADDYLLKPFGGRELVARCRAVLRREHRPRGRGRVTVGDLDIDPDRFEVSRRGTSLRCSTKEMELLFALARRPGMTARREDLIAEVWGVGPAAGRHTLDVHLSSLRKKLGDDARDPHYIVTVHGAGLRLKATA
jgi:DNA-binding response OmpR family regulator